MKLLDKNKLNKVYDFLEIGTSDFETEIQKCDHNAVGISVEPMKIYLDRLPNKPNTIKVNAAIIADENITEIDTYFVPEETIRNLNLGTWLKGCNSVGKPHDFHTGYYPDPRAWHENNHFDFQPINLLEEGYVKVEKVEALTFKKLVERYNVKKIKYLKTDTEGYDPKILNYVLDFYNENNMLENLPDVIYFEWNKHCDKEELEQIKQRLEYHDYEVGLRSEYDIHNRIAILKRSKNV
jgi:hypothetical protein